MPSRATRCYLALAVAAIAIANIVCMYSTRAPKQVRVERIFGPNDPGGKYKHAASIDQLGNGDLYVAFYGGGGEYVEDTAVYGSRRAKGSAEWTRPEIIADTPNRSEGIGVVWQQPAGPVWLFYVVRYGATWSESVIQYKYSNDGAMTWTDSELLSFRKGLMVRSKPIPLPDGDFILPIYHEVGSDTEYVDAESASLFARYCKTTRAWTLSNEVNSRIGNIQPSAVLIDENTLLAYCRRGGGYGPRADGYIVKTESHDGGVTWSRGEDTPFPNPNAAIDLLKLRNGHLVLAYNHSNDGSRNPLYFRVSTDNGKTWPTARKMVDQPEEEQYPYLIQASDGCIHCVFTSHGRSIINHFVVSESEIK